MIRAEKAPPEKSVRGLCRFAGLDWGFPVARAFYAVVLAVAQPGKASAPNSPTSPIQTNSLSQLAAVAGFY